MGQNNIKQNELTFQLMVDASPNALLLINSQGKIVYLNYFAEKLFNYSKLELIGQDVSMMVPERYKERHPDLFKSYLLNPLNRQMGGNRELYALKNGNVEFPVEIGLNPLKTQEGILVIASVIDITERKKANERFRMVVESSPNAIVLVGSNGVISLVNRQTEHLFGYTRAELIGQEVEILLPDKLRKAHPELRNMFLKAPKPRAMGAGRDLFASRKDGTEFPIEIGLNPIETADGDQVLASIIDISERKKIEEAIRMNTKKIEEKNKELEQFTYIASHDLQEPLNTMISFVGLIKESSEGKLNELEESSLQFIEEASARMKRLIKGLLDYGRLGERTESKEINMNSLVESVVYDLDYLIQKSKAKLVIGELPTMYAYETELRLLFQNLISNAIKFVADNKTPEIHIHAYEEQSSWRFSVKDNGIGIDSKYKDRVFVIFQRLHSREAYDGTGIGLAHCRKIVELHNGDIWLDSEVGKGSTFSFTISTNLKHYEKI